jgi:hypothetical protein
MDTGNSLANSVIAKTVAAGQSDPDEAGRRQIPACRRPEAFVGRFGSTGFFSPSASRRCRALDVTTLNVVSHRLESQTHDRRAILAAQQSGKATA